MNLYLAALLFYSIFLMALGIFISRRVKNSSDFLVAGRSLGPGRLFATFLAANIGAGSTVGATGLGYRFGSCSTDHSNLMDPQYSSRRSQMGGLRHRRYSGDCVLHGRWTDVFRLRQYV